MSRNVVKIRLFYFYNRYCRRVVSLCQPSVLSCGVKGALFFPKIQRYFGIPVRNIPIFQTPIGVVVCECIVHLDNK